jgi:hypothetical protein
MYKTLIIKDFNEFKDVYIFASNIEASIKEYVFNNSLQDTKLNFIIIAPFYVISHHINSDNVNIMKSMKFRIIFEDMFDFLYNTYE